MILEEDLTIASLGCQRVSDVLLGRTVISSDLWLVLKVSVC